MASNQDAKPSPIISLASNDGGDGLLPDNGDGQDRSSQPEESSTNTGERSPRSTSNAEGAGTAKPDPVSSIEGDKGGDRVEQAGSSSAVQSSMTGGSAVSSAGSKKSRRPRRPRTDEQYYQWLRSVTDRKLTFKKTVKKADRARRKGPRLVAIFGSLRKSTFVGMHGQQHYYPEIIGYKEVYDDEDEDEEGKEEEEEE